MAINSPLNAAAAAHRPIASFERARRGNTAGPNEKTVRPAGAFRITWEFYRTSPTTSSNCKTSIGWSSPFERKWIPSQGDGKQQNLCHCCRIHIKSTQKKLPALPPGSCVTTDHSINNTVKHRNHFSPPHQQIMDLDHASLIQQLSPLPATLFNTFSVTLWRDHRIKFKG